MEIFQPLPPGVANASEFHFLENTVDPNPFTSQFILSLYDHRNTTQVAIFDITGRHVYSSAAISGDQLLIDTGSWAAGIYLIAVRGDGGVSTLQIVKN
jgi:hypothetical protein